MRKLETRTFYKTENSINQRLLLIGIPGREVVKLQYITLVVNSSNEARVGVFLYPPGHQIIRIKTLETKCEVLKTQ